MHFVTRFLNISELRVVAEKMYKEQETAILQCLC